MGSSVDEGDKLFLNVNNESANVSQHRQTNGMDPLPSLLTVPPTMNSINESRSNLPNTVNRLQTSIPTTQVNNKDEQKTTNPQVPPEDDDAGDEHRDSVLDTPLQYNTASKIVEILQRRPRSASSTPVFASMPEQLKKGVICPKEDTVAYEALNPQEIETKFSELSLAFKTDRLTVKKRVEVLERQRQTSQSNFQHEFNQLRSQLVVHSSNTETDLSEIITDIKRHIDIVATATTRFLSSCEAWGAVQQEWKVSRVLEVVLLHVDNLKRDYEKDHTELEELRKLMTDFNIPVPTISLSNDEPLLNGRRASRTVNLSTEDGRRLSVCTSGPLTRSAVAAFLTSSSSGRRASLLPNIRPFRDIPKPSPLLEALDVSSRPDKNTDKKEDSRVSSIQEEGSDGSSGEADVKIEDKIESHHRSRASSESNDKSPPDEEHHYNANKTNIMSGALLLHTAKNGLSELLMEDQISASNKFLLSIICLLLLVIFGLYIT